jgi:hypothetical protein
MSAIQFLRRDRARARFITTECHEGSLHVTAPPTTTPATTATTTTAAHSRGPRATPGSRQALHSVRVAARTDDGDPGPLTQVGHDFPGVDTARGAIQPASSAFDSASENDDSARDANNTARDATDSAGEMVDPPGQDRKSLVLMTWNASRLLSSGRELALSNLLISSAVDIATVTECEMPETANDFAVAGYTTFHPLVPKGKSKTRVIILVKNDLVTRANAHVCHDLTSATTSWTTKRSRSGCGSAWSRPWAASPSASAGCTGRHRTMTGGFSTSMRQRRGWGLLPARSPELPRGMPEW